MRARCGGREIVLKLELLQHTGSFKVRGALNHLLAAEIPIEGVVAASGGNHGIAVAYAAARIGSQATVFVPRAAPEFKVKAIQALGSSTVQLEDYPRAVAAAEAHAQRTGALHVHAYDDPYIIAGQGTLSAEIDRQLPCVRNLYMAVGGGGLVSGAASWFGPDTVIFGAEPYGAPTLERALAHGGPTDVMINTIAADSLGATRLGSIVFPIVEGLVTSVLVDDSAILSAQRWLWDELRIVAEPGGATALAAAMSRSADDEAEGSVVVICGANIDPSMIASLPSALD